MWNVSLCAVNIFYYHWLIMKLIWPTASRIEPGKKYKQRYRGKKGGIGTNLQPLEKQYVR